MCGIAGIVNFLRPLGLKEQNAVESMAEAQLHRGPDGGGIFVDEHVVLGHRRLSIIDVSEDGKQPMSNETESVWVSFNGEIYNYRELRAELKACGHRFRSHSDTEVLVHGYEQWGEERLLKKLRGMFAFAIFDGPRRRVVVARDRLGIKPLYYCHDATNGQLSFVAS
jgi:asparagine synthase (glutamine-hydrolysing)